MKSLNQIHSNLGSRAGDTLLLISQKDVTARRAGIEQSREAAGLQCPSGSGVGGEMGRRRAPLGLSMCTSATAPSSERHTTNTRTEAESLGTAQPAAAVSIVESFGKAVNGEWIGFESEYGKSDGVLRAVPDWQMPDSLIEWEVFLPGYEHLTSSVLLSESGMHKLRIKRNRLLPTVGCAVDAVPTDKFEKESELADQAGLVVFEDGSWFDGSVNFSDSEK